MIDLYTWTTPNGRKASIALEELGLAYTAHAVDISKDEQFKPEFLKISPNNRIPAIVDRDNGMSLMESGAILIYLADKTGKLLPKEGEARYRVIEWLMWQMGGPGPMLGQVHHFVKYNKGKAPYAEERYLKEAHRLYGVLDRRLAEHEFVADAYSIADIAIWPWISRFEWQTIDMNQYPNVKRWYHGDRQPAGDAKGIQGPEGRGRDPSAVIDAMSRDRLVPLIVAVALFMENMDSTVIATSLPAIAADIGTSPLALKLAVTSYLLSLAVFIPASGWTADRFGARTVFRAAIAVFVLGLDRLRAVRLARGLRHRADRARDGRRHDDAGRTARPCAQHRQAGPGRRHGVGDHSCDDRPRGGPPGRGLHHHLRLLALDLPDQCADRTRRHHPRHALYREHPRRGARSIRFSRHGAGGLGMAGLAFGFSVLGLDYLPWPIVAGLIGGGAVAALAYVAHARRTPAPVLDLSLLAMPTFRASVLGGFLFRIGVGALPFLLPLLLQIGFGLTPFQSGLDHVLVGARRHDDEGARHDDPQALRFSHRARRKRAVELGPPGGLRGVHPRYPDPHDHRDPADRRLPPFAGVHQHQHDRLCGHPARAS